MIAWILAFVCFAVWLITRQGWSLIAAHIYIAASLVIAAGRAP